MGKIEITIYEDGQLIKQVPCKAYLLATDEDENNTSVNLLLHNDMDTMRIVSTCLAGGIQMIMETGKEAGMTEQANEERFHMIFKEILRTAFDAVEIDFGRMNHNEALQ